MSQLGLRTILYSNAESSPLGRITLAASIENGRGIVPPLPYRVYGSYALVYITAGSGSYRDANGCDRAIEAGDLILVFPELPHTYGPVAGATWSEFYIVFDGIAFDSWRAMGVLNAHEPIRRVQPVDRWLARFLEVTGEDASGAEGQSLRVCRLLTLLTEIAALPSASAQPRPDLSGGRPEKDDRRWITRACALLGEDLSAGTRLEEFAERLGLSAQALRKRFKDELGMSPARYRARRRIETACDLLQYTGMTSAQIAEGLGFTDEYHFSKRFKQLQGESPREFRRRHLR